MSLKKYKQQLQTSSAHEFLPEDFLIPELPKDDKTPDKNDYEGKLKKIELETKEGLINDKYSCRKEAFDLGRLLREKLSSLPSKLAAKVSAERNIKKNERLIRDECDRCCREILRRMADIRRR